MVLAQKLSCSEALVRKGVPVTIMRYCPGMKRLPLLILVCIVGACVSAEDGAHNILA